MQLSSGTENELQSIYPRERKLMFTENQYIDIYG